jgi:hypothetical protein
MGLTNFAAKKLINYNSEKSPAFKLRQKRAERIKDLIELCNKTYGRVRIIDIGGTKLYWKIIPQDFLKKHKVHITVLNLPSGKPLPPDDDLFAFREGDGCNLSDFSDNSFHIAHSNSVIEHVGSWENMKSFSKEIRRVATNYYLQTPNYWFPVEPHFMTPFFHWLPRRIRVFLLMNFKLGWYNKAKTRDGAENVLNHCSLLKKKHLRSLFPEGKIYKEKILGFVKSFVVMNR